MTKDEFLAKYRYEMAGRILDAAVDGRRGTDLALFCRTVFRHVDDTLQQMWFDLAPHSKEERQ